MRLRSLRMRKGQGAMEYLLIFAAIVIVIGAVAYLMATQSTESTHEANIRAAEQIYERGRSHNLLEDSWTYAQATRAGTVYWYVNTTSESPNYMDPNYPLRDVHGGGGDGQYANSKLWEWYEATHA